MSKSWEELMCSTTPSWRVELLKSLAQPDFVFVVAAVEPSVQNGKNKHKQSFDIYNCLHSECFSRCSTA